MKTFSIQRNSVGLTLAALVATAGMANIASAVLPPKHDHAHSTITNVDVRTPSGPAKKDARDHSARDQGAAKLKQQVPGVEVKLDTRLGTPRSIHSREGFLTGPDGVGRGVSSSAKSSAHQGQPDRALRLFLDEHPGLFGFNSSALSSANKTRDAVGKNNGVRSVVWEQKLKGVPVFDAKLVANITKRGELVNVSSRFNGKLKGGSTAPAINAKQAIASALAGMGEAAGQSVADDATPTDAPYEKFTVGGRKASARLVFLPVEGDSAKLAWEIYVNSRVTREGFQILVDAATGETLVRKNLTLHISDATYNVYTGESPSPFAPGWPTPNNGQPPLVSRTLVTTPALSTLASPNGWINDGDNETLGNNVDAFVDRDFDFLPDGPRPQGNPARIFDFPLDLTQDPLTYSNAAVVQMFYKLNVYHDRLYELGFTEAFGNYQRDNFGRGGFGNDEMTCYIQAGAGVGQANNAFFIAAPDGNNGQIAMFVWDFPNPQRDGDLDSDIIIHEATHGLSWRLVGGGFALGNLQGDGMGEGWADFYGLALSSEPADDPDGVYPAGAYVGFQFAGLAENYYYGVRHFPYSTDMTKNPFTYKDIDPTQISAHPGVPRSPIYTFDPSEASEVHHQGEVWCAMLWEVRANLIHKHGGAVGNQLAMLLVTEGMKLTPPTPTFVEARDGILLADQVLNAGANVNEIWRGFAKRGLGVGATSPDPDTTTGVEESFNTPGLQVIDTVVTLGNGNFTIDPNECNDLFLTLTNASGVTATSVKLTLSSSTPGVYVIQPTINIPLFPVGAAISNIGPFRVSTIPEFKCGTPVVLSLDVKSQQGNNTDTISLPTGVVGTSVRFDSLIPVPIPDSSFAVSPITVTNVVGAIGDVTVSLYLNHTFDFDLTLELIAPDGTTCLLASAVGFSGDNFGVGCAPDSFRTTFSDTANIPIAGGAPPFIGQFRPMSPLSVFNAKSGTNVNGAWLLRVTDDISGDVGVINCWSLNLASASCVDGGGSCPGTDLALIMTDAPDPVLIGSNLVYTLTVTNIGPNAAKGTVLAQNLPASVIFLSATTTGGTVNHSAGVVAANLGTLPLGASATVTVTVLPTTVGAIVSSAFVSSTEPENVPPNNAANVTTLVQAPSADLAVTLTGTPNPTVVGGALTYTANVQNNGPSTATGVVVTNTLPASVLVTSASSSQGSVSINGNIVIVFVGTLANGATATATINTVPLAAGTIVANARVTGNLLDRVPGNNTSSTSTTVGLAADLGISITDSPDPVVVNSNFTYTVTVTNRGPNPATSVIVNQSLSPILTVVSSNSSQGAVILSGSTLVWSVGNIPATGTATLTLVARSGTTGTVSSTVNVNGAQTDLNLADNTASASTLIATPFVSIVPAGASLEVESFTPANGAVDVGETVTMSLRLRNAGNIPNTNLVATLLATGGVTSPSGPQTYGVLSPGGLPVGADFTFTAAGVLGGDIIATLQITDGGNFLTNVTFTFALPRQFSFTNSAAITIPSIGSATPYPSTIVVSGVTGAVGQVTATLRNFNHTYAPDVDVLLVGPLGQRVILMGTAGGVYGAANATVTFSDTAALPVPQHSPVVGGDFKPANYNPSPSFPSPAPVAPYSSGLSTFANLTPNGTWSLYIVDHATGDAGNVASGWSLTINVISPVNNIADVGVTGVVAPVPTLVGDNATWTVTVTNGGPSAANGIVVTNTLSAGLVLQSASSSTGVTSTNGNKVVSSLGTFDNKGTATISIVARVVNNGVQSVTAVVASSDIDLNPANNTAVISASTTLPLADMAVGITAGSPAALTGSLVTYTVNATNTGPGQALNATVNVPLAAGFVFSSATPSKGSAVPVGNAVLCSFGNLVANETVTATIVVIPTTAGSVTTTATASTSSADNNAANNSGSAVVLVSNPGPVIVASGSVLVFEAQSPANGGVDAGENVTIAFALANNGQLPTANLTATLLATGGVNSPGGAQNYGVIIPGAPATSRNFNFTAANTPGATITATLQLNDNGTPLGSVTFTFGLSRAASFTNNAPIIIPDQGTAALYPSVINVSGITGVVGKVTMTLNGIAHSFPADLDVLLVGPQGQKIMIMSDAGEGVSVTGVNLGFDDAAGPALPLNSALTSGTFRTTDYQAGEVMPFPAPSGAPGTQLSVFNGTDPNGDWLLFVHDDSPGDAGTISGGWSLSLNTIDPVAPLANLGIIAATAAPSAPQTGELLTYEIQVTNRGSSVATGVIVRDLLPAGAILETLITSQGTHSSAPGEATFNLGQLASGASAQLTVVARMTVAGNSFNAINITGAQNDPDLSDNFAGVTALVSSGVPTTLEGIYDAPNQLFEINLVGKPGATYVLQRSADLVVWSPVATDTASAGGVIKFTDTATPGVPQRFYRAVQLVP